MRDEPDDFLSPELKEQRKAESAERARRQLQIEEGDLATLMSQPWGRRVMRRILDQHYWRDSVFNQNAVVMGSRASRQEWAMAMRATLESALPEFYLAMERERLEDEQRERADQ